MNRRKYDGASLALLALLGGSTSAWAQTTTGAPPPPPPAAAAPAAPAAAPPADASAPASASGSMGFGFSAGTTAPPTAGADANAQANAAPVESQPPPPLPPPPPPVAPVPPPAPDLATQTDHERVIGKWGVGLLGVTTLNQLQPNGNFNVVNAPIIGVRHWVNDAWGLQFGVGVAHHSGTFSNNLPEKSNVDDLTTWGFAGQFGLPLAFYHDKHYAFLFLPEATFGFSTWRRKDDANVAGDDGVSGRAWVAGIGARLGAEIHFGFMDLPMLTLQGTVGAHATYQDSGVKSVDARGREIEQGRNSFDLTTAKYNDPWDIFRSSISALYYFK